jgi:SAM-dependent methyltransferase
MSIFVRALRRALRPIFPRLTWGTDIRRIGEYISFTERGFAAADSPSDLLFRNYYEQAELRRLLAGRDIRRSLEIGCGYGRHSAVLAELSQDHVGVDINPEALDMAKRHYPHVKFQVAPATRLPFRDESFDAVVTWTVLQHIPPHRIESAAAEMVRVTRSGGSVILLEASRYADRKPDPWTHTFDRSAQAYQQLLAPLRLIDTHWIEGIHRVHPYSPGEVMVFEK